MTSETIAFQLTAFLLAPLMLGVVNRTKAWFAGRRGAPLLQPYYDIWKLLQKGAVYSTTTTWLFRAGPVIGLAAVAAAMFLVPAGGADALFAFQGDLVMFAGLMALARFAMVVAALDTGSSFEGMGASREVMISAFAEVALFLGLLVPILFSTQFSLSAAIGAGSAGPWSGASIPALLLASGALFLVLLAENSRVPVDDPNTHLELTMVHEVMVLDHSGPDFGFIMYTSALKLWVFATLFLGILVPIGVGNALADGFIYLGGMLLIAVAIGVVESSMARLRILLVPHLLTGAAVLGVLGVILALVVR